MAERNRSGGAFLPFTVAAAMSLAAYQWRTPICVDEGSCRTQRSTTTPSSRFGFRAVCHCYTTDETNGANDWEISEYGSGSHQILCYRGTHPLHKLLPDGSLGGNYPTIVILCRAYFGHNIVAIKILIEIRISKLLSELAVEFVMYCPKWGLCNNFDELI